MRVHVVGPQGSGKTYLARHIAARYDVPTHDLDEVAFSVGPGGRGHSLDERLSAVHAIAEQPSWVTEGIYAWWIGELLEAGRSPGAGGMVPSGTGRW